ncbi:hypothetical protein P3L10_004884 [Capsicum annuum]
MGPLSPSSTSAILLGSDAVHYGTVLDMLLYEVFPRVVSIILLLMLLSQWLVCLLTVQSAHVMVSSSLHAFDSNQQGYHGQTVHHGGAEWRPLPPSMSVDNFQNLDAKNTSLLQYGHDPHPPNSSQLTDNFKKVELAKDQYLEKEVLEEVKMKRESSAHKLNEPEKCGPWRLKKKKLFPRIHPSVLLPSPVSGVEASNSAAAAVPGNSVFPSKINEKSQEQSQGTVSLGVVQEEKPDGYSEDSHFSGRTLNACHGDSEAYPYDLSHKPPSMPLCEFFVLNVCPGTGCLNWLSKSDDSSATQFIMTHAHSEGSQQILESVDKLHDGNVNPHIGRFIQSDKNPSANQMLPKRKRLNISSL